MQRIMFKSENLETSASTPPAEDTSYCNNTLTHLTPFLNPFGCVKLFLLEGFISKGSFLLMFNKGRRVLLFLKEQIIQIMDMLIKHINTSHIYFMVMI